MICSRPLHGINLEAIIDVTTDSLLELQLDLEALTQEIQKLPDDMLDAMASTYIITQTRTMQASINETMLRVRAIVHRKERP